MTTPAHPSRGSALFAFALIAVVYAAITPLLPVGPSPSDDLFYIDAAHEIATGTYQAPTPARPYHHYLRWPVTLPLAGIFATVGPGNAALAIYQLANLVAIALLATLLVHALTRDWAIAAVAALAPLLMPVDVLPVLIRSEPAALIAALASMTLAAIAYRRPRILPILCGMCMAVAVNANNVSVFATPLPLLLLVDNRDESLSWKKRIRRMLLFVFGAWLMYESIMFTEWLVLGDHMIQLKAMRWWHFRLTESHTGWSAHFDPHDKERFVLGLSTNLVRRYPLFVLALFFAALIIPLTVPRIRAFSSRILPGALASIVLLEVAGGFVIQKIYLRFLAIPCFIIVVTLAAVVAGLFRRTRHGAASPIRRRPVAITSSLLAIILPITFFECANARSMFTDDAPTRFYHDPVNLILHDMKRRKLHAHQVAILCDRPGAPGLIPWRIALPCYSGFRLSDAAFGDNIASTQSADRAFTYLIITDKKNAIPQGFVEVSNPAGPSACGPRVFFHDAGETRLDGPSNATILH